MAIEIPRGLIEHILLGSGDSRRQIQDSPILIDVWVKFAKNPDEPTDLLITSHKESTSTALAAEIYRGIWRPEGAEHDPVVAPLQNFVAARLYFGEVLTILVPLTGWWQDPATQTELDAYDTADSPKLTQTVNDVVDLRKRWLDSPGTAAVTNKRSAFERFVAVCTLVCLAGLDSLHEDTEKLAGLDAFEAAKEKRTAAKTRLMDKTESDITATVLGLLQSMKPKPKPTPMVWQIALNRRAAAAVAHSVPTVKADAARRLFDVDCSGIDWAVLDTGIDEKHPAFGNRVKATYDFTNYREIVSLGNERQQVRKMNLEILKQARDGKLPTGADGKLKKIGEAATAGQPLPLDLVTDMVRLTDPPSPKSEHGTHVAGIIAACKYTDPPKPESFDGMCPGIGIYDFRVLKSDTVQPRDLENTEFSIIAALQFIRNTNGQAGRLVVNGINMSLSIPHDVKNYACGRTPICDESERLIDNGVVVVAAAGNKGAEETIIDGISFYDYLGFGITDPGNADRVITVGSTHGSCPFTYGISYFSSRGPTGDGRLKPDLVAPGEGITSTVPGGAWASHDGTSQAAPHVSGAAAMLMARYPELIGNPDRIKRILCDTSTDLNRERSFQGHGLLDVLRALQSL
jgi:serine protease AprX